MIPAIPAMLSRIPLSVWTGAIGAGAVYLALALPAQIEARSEARRADRAEANLERAVSDLATCRGNASRLTDALERQSAAITELEADAAERQARAAEAVRLAQAGRIEAERRAEAILSRPIQGETVCERVQDVDSAILDVLRGQGR